MSDPESTKEPHEAAIHPIVHEWSWGRMLRRQWVALILSSGLLLHIGCLVALQVAETQTDAPATGALGTLQTVASKMLCANVLVMTVAVLIDSHLHCRRRAREVDPDQLDADGDIPLTQRQAASELRFISAFSRSRWRTPFRVLDVVSRQVLHACTWLLVPCILASVFRVFLPSGLFPELAVRCVQFSLAIVSLLALLAATLLVLSWVYFKYEDAKKRVTFMLNQGLS